MVDLAWFWPVKGWLLRCSTAAMLCNKFSVLNSGPAAVGKKMEFFGYTILCFTEQEK